MASIQSNKRHKTGTFELEASHTAEVGDVINSILNIDREAFKEHVSKMDRGAFKLLATRLSELSQDRRRRLQGRVFTRWPNALDE
jgi:hypothetical protein